MKDYRKKPVIIQAEEFFMDEYDATGYLPTGVCDCAEASGVHCHTLEGVLTVNHNDWIIIGVKGEIYPCKPDIFLMTYEAV